MRADEQFTPLRIIKKNLQNAGKSRYRVYKNAEEFVTVDAATATQAIQESAIARPYRIVRETRFMERLIDGSRILESGDFVETCQLVMEPMEAITPHQEPVPTVASAPARNLGAPEESPVLESAPPQHAPLSPSSPPPVQGGMPSPESLAAAAADSASEEDWEDALIAGKGDANLSPQEVSSLLGERKAGVAETVTDAEVKGESPLSPDEISKLLGS